MAGRKQTETDLAPEARTAISQVGGEYLQLLRQLQRNFKPVQYEFMDLSEFEAWLVRGDVARVNRVYWSEILYRAHIAGVTSLFRAQRWLEGMATAATAANFFAYCSCLRGYMEACADSKDALMHVALTLAECRTTVEKALAGTLPAVILSADLEDPLVHFTHARRLSKGDPAPETHRAKATADYLKGLPSWGKGDGPLKELYGLLCEVTHPAFMSVAVFQQSDATGTHLRVTAGEDAALINQMATKNAEILEELVYMGLNPALFTLKVLNVIGPSKLRTPSLDSIDITAPGWVKITEALQANELR